MYFFVIFHGISVQKAYFFSSNFNNFEKWLSISQPIAFSFSPM